MTQIELAPMYSFGAVSVDRPHEAHSGEHCAVYYRKPRLKLRSARTVWLSETLDEPGSHGWGAEPARVATVAMLFDHVWSRSIVVINTRFHWLRIPVKVATHSGPKLPDTF